MGQVLMMAFHRNGLQCHVSIDHLSSLVQSAGKGALLIKADIKEAYRVLPIHPDDQALLGVQWKDNI